MVFSYYLDESGSSGDLINSGHQFDFARQPIFVLACIGVDDPHALNAEIQRLKKAHNVQSAELKSTSVRDKPAFVAELLGYLRARNLPVMLEIVDKRFQICATMVSNLVMPVVAPVDLEPEALWVRNQMAEYMHAVMPSEVLQAYIEACEAASLEGTHRSYQALINWAESKRAGDEFAQGIYLFAADTYDDFRVLDESSPDTWRNGLPIPDDSKRGKPFWMLPNLSSFTNVYARINRLHKRKISGISLFHDGQSQFDQIIQNAKADVEGLALKYSVPLVAFADYTFTEKSQLCFVTSETEPGIQVADVVAGFAMRYVQDKLYGTKQVPAAFSEAFDLLQSFTDTSRSLGLNFVMTASQISTLGLRKLDSIRRWHGA